MKAVTRNIIVAGYTQYWVYWHIQPCAAVCTAAAYRCLSFCRSVSTYSTAIRSGDRVVLSAPSQRQTKAAAAAAPVAAAAAAAVAAAAA